MIHLSFAAYTVKCQPACIMLQQSQNGTDLLASPQASISNVPKSCSLALDVKDVPDWCICSASLARIPALEQPFGPKCWQSYNRVVTWCMQAVMQDPVIAADGHTFEREAMQRWLHCHTASPVTGQQLNHLRLVPNIVTRSAIRAQLEG